MRHFLIVGLAFLILACNSTGPEDYPDLMVELRTENISSEVGKEFPVSVTVRNKGESDLATLRYYRSSDDIFSNDDRKISTAEIGAAFSLFAIVRNNSMVRSDSTILLFYRSSDLTRLFPYPSLDDFHPPSLDDFMANNYIIASDIGPLTADDEPLSKSFPAESGEGSCYFRVCVEPVNDEIATTNNCSYLVKSTANIWSSLSEEQKNEEILKEARMWVNTASLQTGGHCKYWIQICVVHTVSGLYLPGNFIEAGHPYNKAKWKEDNPERNKNVKVVWQCNKPDSALDFLKTHPNTIKPGNIIQFRKQGDYNNAVDSIGLHTALIESVNSQSMNWIDSNRYGKKQVRQHVFPFSAWADSIEAWTIYQVR